MIGFRQPNDSLLVFFSFSSATKKSLKIDTLKMIESLIREYCHVYSSELGVDCVALWSFSRWIAIVEYAMYSPRIE